jgi:F0F1-type ATP synthase delta subunit
VKKESFIDEIIKCTERKEIEDKMKNININLLLSYNVNKTMNLITGTKDHAERDHIYNVLYKLLEIAEIKELPMLIYNTSLDPNKYESILDVLVKNKAFKLALLIVSIAIKQDQIGYIYSRLYQYLSIFSANELQMFFENQIFFFKVPLDCYEEYQIVKKTLTRPFSGYKTFSEIYKNMKSVES